MNKLFDKIIEFVLQHKKAVTVLLVFVTILAIGNIFFHLKVDNSVSIWFLEDNPQYQEYLQFQEEQGSDEIIVLMIPLRDSLSDKDLETLRFLHEDLDTNKYVNSTFSLANVKYPIYSNKKLFYRNIYTQNRSLENSNNILDELPTIKNTLLTEDGKYVLFYVQLLSTKAIDGVRKEVVENIEKVIDQRLESYHISGSSILNEAYNQTVYEESIFFAVATGFVIFFILLFLLPHPVYLPIALLCVIVPVGLLLGLLTAFGYDLNMISMLIPTILMVYSVSDVIHIINIYHLHKNEFPDQSKILQIQLALHKSLKPCFFTTVTTIIGYLALYLSPLPAFKVMGVFTFIGLLLSFLLVYFIVIIGFSYLPEVVDQKYKILTIFKKIQLRPLIQKVNWFTGYYKKSIVIFCSMLMIVGVYSISLLEVNTDNLNMLGKGKARADLEIIEEKINGSARLHLNISSMDDESLLSKANLEKLEAFQIKLENYALLASPISIINFRSFLEKRTPTFLQITNRSNLDNILTSSTDEANAFFSLFTDDYSRMGISVSIRELQSKELEHLMDEIKKDFKSIFQEDLYRIEIQGFSALFVQLNQFILQTQFRSFSTAFVLSFFVLFLFIGKVRTSFLAIIPNLLPLFLTVTLMVLLGIPLEASNAMLAPIMLGIAMDDTIHLVNKFKHFKTEGVSAEESINKASLYTGSALFSTTISLVCGFLVVGLSGVVSVSTFGFLCAFTILAALFADIIFLPALIKCFAK